LPAEIVHVVPGRSAAGTVREAVRTLGLREKVIALGDNLGYGPIDGDRDARRKWLDDIFGPGWGEAVDLAELSFAVILQPNVFPVIWTCRDNAGDYSAFLEFLSRIGDRPFQCIDLTGKTVEGKRNHWIVPSLGVVSETQMIAANFFSRRNSLSPKQTSLFRDIWRRLKEENAELRIVGEGELRSKPIWYFDGQLMNYVDREWTLGVRIVGAALAGLVSGGVFLADSFIWSRYCTLADEGIIKMEPIEGDETGMRGHRIRYG